RFIKNQLADGGWNYMGTSETTGSMTAAGLTVLFITQDYLHAKDALQLGGERGQPYQKSLDLGLQWMDKNFSATDNPGRAGHYFYYMYGVERVGMASGYK